MRRVCLHFLTGRREGRVEVYPVERFQGLSFGRDPRCDVRFHPTEEAVVSRNHAMLEWAPEDPHMFRLFDLLSSNGTYVNGRRIASAVLLCSGDEIKFGASGPALRFEIDEVADDTPPDATREMRKPRVTTEMPIATMTRKVLDPDQH